MLLGLDIAQTTGFCVGGAEAKAPRLGIWTLPEGPDNYVRALSSLRQAVYGIVRFEKVTDVWIEAALRTMNGKRGPDTAFLLTSFSAVAQEAAHSAGARVHTVACQTWRKTVLGHGFPEEPKKKMMALCDGLGWRYQTDDAAEAAGVWLHGQLISNPKFQMPRMKAPALAAAFK